MRIEVGGNSCQLSADTLAQRRIDVSIEERPHSESAQTSALAHHSYARVSRATEYMRKHFVDTITLNDLADIACYSPWHFDRLFQSQMGVTPMIFLMILRIAAARRKVTMTTDSIINIAYDVGYNSVGSFGRRFTTLVGTSPTDLRRAAKGFDRAHCIAMMERASGHKTAPGPRGVGFLSCAPDLDRQDLDGFGLITLRRRGQIGPLPLAYTVARVPGPFRITVPSEGNFELEVLYFPDAARDQRLLTQDDLPRAHRCLTLNGGETVAVGRIEVERPTSNDLPIPPVFPLLLFQSRTGAGA